MIPIRTGAELERIRASGEILRDAFAGLGEMIRPGTTTGELDEAAEKMIRSRGALPAFKGYKGYPAAICASINEQVVHGIPGRRALAEGDIVGIDMGALLDGFYADATRSFAVGEVSEQALSLLRVTSEALDLGIEQARPGNRVSDISYAIQTHAEQHGYSVVRALVGHGIGRRMHEEPPVPNFGPAGQGPQLRAGMVLAIEPMINAGTHEVLALEDAWTFVTVDGALSCHFEDTVAITGDGPMILTR